MTALDDDPKSDLYRQQSDFVRKLATMAKQYNVLIFLIAHPRKSDNGSLAGFGNDDVAGSANITNLCDAVLNYARPKYDSNEEPDETLRMLQVTKNRLYGRLTKDGGIKLYFDEKSKRMSEMLARKEYMWRWELGWETDDFDTITDDEVIFD